MSFVFVDPPSPPGFVAFRHSHGGYGECCRTSRLKFPTLDLFHGASTLLEHGFEASIVDSVLHDHSQEECVAAILARKPETVVFRTSTGSCGHDLATAERLRAVFAGPIVFYGPHVSTEPGTILASAGVDAIVTGEAPPLFLRMAREGGLAEVPGVWRKSGGRLVKNAPAPPMDLEALPVPRWDLVDFRRYSYVTAQTSWGCPFQCGYCPYPVTQGREWRVRSTAGVVSEFVALRERYGLRFVLLRDPEFTLRRERAVELCEALIEAGTPLTWGCETRLDTLDTELIDLMARAGCLRVAFGVDSVHAPTLKLMGRRSALDDIRAKTESLKRRGILTYGMYIIGLPGETRRSTRALIDFALELDTNAASFSMATPFPGTELERLGRERGSIEARDPARLTGCVPSMRTEALALAEVEELYLTAKKEWNRSRELKKDPLPSSALSARR